MVIGAVLGHFFPELAVELKPLGDAFIKLVKMVIGPVIFLTVAGGIAGMSSLSRLGSTTGKALLYFFVVSSFALVIGLVVANVVEPGRGMDVDPATLDSASVSGYVGKAEEQTIVDFLLSIIPDTFAGALTSGQILPVLFIAIIFGVSVASLGESRNRIQTALHDVSESFFKMVSILMKLAPIGAFGAFAFTIGKYGIDSIANLAALIDIYMTLAALFIAQATGIELSLHDELLLLLVAVISSKGAAGVTGAGFITLAATLAVVPTVPVAGMALILGIDRFMSECRAVTNFIGNAVATIVVARWEGALDRGALGKALMAR